MQTYQYDGPIAPLLAWADPPVPITDTMRRHNPPEPWKSWAESLLDPTHTTIEYFAGIGDPSSWLDDTGDWVFGFPHRHIDTMRWQEASTAMTYLEVPTAGGEFALGGLLEADPYELLVVTPGITVVVDHLTWHGVKPITAGRRVVAICTGQP